MKGKITASHEVFEAIDNKEINIIGLEEKNINWKDRKWKKTTNSTESEVWSGTSCSNVKQVYQGKISSKRDFNYCNVENNGKNKIRGIDKMVR